MNIYINNFNPNAKVKHSEYVTYINKLKMYRDHFSKDEEKKDEDTKERVKEDLGSMRDLMTFSFDLQTEINELQNELKTKLIKIFFGLSQEAVDDLDILEFSELYAKIEQEKPALVEMLQLKKIQIV